MLGASQSLHRDAIVVKVSGHVGTTRGLRQDCPLSPTLFGLYIDALEGWLREQAPGAAVGEDTPRGVACLLAALIYADNIALFDSEPIILQRLLDSLASFCAACGLDISLSKTNLMQFTAAAQREPVAANAAYLHTRLPHLGQCRHLQEPRYGI